MNHSSKNLPFQLIHPLIITICASFAITGCSQPAKNDNKKTATNASSVASSVVPNGKVLSIALDTSYPPYDMQDDKGVATGFDVDILTAIGKKQGFSVNFLPQPWEGTEDALAAGKFDGVMSALSLNDTRKQNFEVSEPYAYGKDAIMTLADKTNINTMDDLKNHKVATQAETGSAEELIKIQGPNNPNTILETTNFLAFKDVITGKADVALADSGVLHYYAKSYPNVKLRFAGQGEIFEPYEMIFTAKKGNKELIQQFNTGLKQIVADGTYATIHQKWFGVAPTPEQLPHGILSSNGNSATASATNP